MVAGAPPPFVVDGVRLSSIYEINSLPDGEKEAIYRELIPTELLERFHINPRTLTDRHGNRLVSFKATPGTGSVEVEVLPEPGAVDPLLYLHLADTPNNQLEVLLFIVNDPTSPRFDVDRDWQGERTKFGTLSRNIPAEVAAMEAGLAPGQVRRGLRLTKKLIPLFERFVWRLGRDIFFAEPLAYHNAILLERYGFNYVQGWRKMEWIHAEFAPGGLLYRRLDGSTPFRRRGMERTVRGRSWAIHDGILGEPYTGVQMYKRVGHHAGVCTFPNATW